MILEQLNLNKPIKALTIIHALIVILINPLQLTPETFNTPMMCGNLIKRIVIVWMGDNVYLDDVDVQLLILGISVKNYDAKGHCVFMI